MYVYTYIYMCKLLSCSFAQARSKAKTGPGDRSTQDDAVPGASSSASAPPPAVMPVKAKPDAGLAQIMLKRAELKHLEVE